MRHARGIGLTSQHRNDYNQWFHHVAPIYSEMRRGESIQ